MKYCGDDTLFTRKELMEYLSIKAISTIKQMEKDGLKCYCIGDNDKPHIRYKLSDVIEYLNKYQKKGE